MILSLLGPSGSGKGTHIPDLCEAFALDHAGAGDLLRENLRGRTALGILARRYMDAGELVPNELVEAMMEEWIRKRDVSRGILLDGFPRTPLQAEFLDRLLFELGMALDAVLYFDISDDAVVDRLGGRRICSDCHQPWHVEWKPPRTAGICDTCGGTLYSREDDIPLMIMKRLRVFHRESGPVLRYYQECGRLRVINAAAPVEHVASATRAVAAAVQTLALYAPPADLLHRFEPTSPAAPAPQPKIYPALDLVLFGGPGSGKGTQADYLCSRLSLARIATGELFRENLHQKTELGTIAQTYMNRGELVPDDVTEAMVQERLRRDDTVKGFVLDGFPRSLPQAEALTEMLNEANRRLSGVVYINVSDEELIRRLAGRLICRTCQKPYHKDYKPPQQPKICDTCGGELYQREDDNAETVKSRLRTYHAQMQPLIDYYNRGGLIVEVDGEGTLEAVQQRSLEAVMALA